MRTGGVVLLNLALIFAGLWIYHRARRPVSRATASRPPPAAPKPADPARDAIKAELDAGARRLFELKARVHELRRDLSLVGAEVRTGMRRATLLGDERIAWLRRHVEEVERRQVAERRTKNLRIAIRELQLGLTERERQQVVEIIQRSHKELGEHGAWLRREGEGRTLGTNARYDEIRRRYHAELRDLLTPKQSETLIARFIALR